MMAFLLKQRSTEVISSISPCLFSALVSAYRIKLRELQVYRMLFDVVGFYTGSPTSLCVLIRASGLCRNLYAPMMRPLI